MSAASSKPGHEFPDKGPAVAWGPAAALALGIPAILAAQVLAGLVLALVAAGGNLPDSWLTTAAAQFYFVLASDAVILLFIWYLLRKRGAKFGQLGFGRKPGWKDLALVIVGYLAYLAVFIVLSVVARIFTPIDVDQDQEIGFDFLPGLSDKLMAFASLVVLTPIIEEVVFRGYIFTGLRSKLKFVWAALITSMLFAGLHLLGSSQGLLWIAGLDTIVLSFVLCYLRETTGALWAPMAVHAIKNAIAFTFLLSSVAML